jgi:O-Antigen ligase
MELTMPRPPISREHARRVPWDLDVPAISSWTLTFTLVLYLSLRGGGYDTVVRSDTGLIVWWLVLLGAATGILPGPIGRWGWAAIGLLTAFGVWTGLAIGWSESAEQSVLEVGRIASYLGFLVLAVALQGRSVARHTVNALASAIGVVTLLAVLSRLHPQWFPQNPDFRFLGPTAASKLSYPIGYWNALAAFAAIGAPLLLSVAVGGRTLVGRALAAAALPVTALCVYLTISRGGAIELGLGVVVFMLISPRRLEAVGTLALTGAASALLIGLTHQRHALTDGLQTAAAHHQGNQILALTIVVCGLVGALQAAATLAARRRPRPAFLTADRRTTTRRTRRVLVGALIVALALGVPGKLHHAWHDFKQPMGVVSPGSMSSVFSRLGAANGNSRYQFWQAAGHAFDHHPVGGTGPGTFQFWWARHATADGFVRNAHSLYMETLAETGIVGFALLIGLLVTFAAFAARRALRSEPGPRLWLSAAAGALAAFLLAAAVEWVWQLAAIAAAALTVGAVIVCGRDEGDGERALQPAAPSTKRPRWVAGALLAALAVVALGAILVPLGGTVKLRASQSAAANGNLSLALRDSLAAERLQPYASAPYVQEATVLEAAGRLGDAAVAARTATRNSPTDWTTWLTLARIDARRGDDREGLAALAKARQLNPRFTVFSASR